MTEKPHFYIFGDGSSSRQDDIGAWASVIVTGNGEKRKLLFGVDYPTTISRCELRPVIESLRWLKANWMPDPYSLIRVYSDSEFTVKTLTGALENRSKNRELWAALDEAKKGLKVEYRWRERNSTDYMTFCDGVAGPFRRKMIDVMKQIAQDPRKPEADMPILALPED